MKKFRLILAAFALVLTSSTFANSNAGYPAANEPIPVEIEKMLKDSNLIIEDSFTVTVIFKVTADKRIEIQNVSSPNEEVNTFLERRLDNQKLHGKNWFSNKIYELPVKVESRK
ncbi:hypothetical protein [Salinimicrobium xinjiangense]|uniref:hypothetical protein n=1 Tax=Salinimicrobium xinjiangense TaxID=438596 RepID=UPI0003F9B3FA|nr:hypothetical protein [Salinimicrobium xinjiangense]